MPEAADMAAELAGTSVTQGDITYSTNNGLIEIVPRGSARRPASRQVAGPLGITDEDVVAFGDMPNDVPLLLWAGLGVAMGNAHPDAIGCGRRGDRCQRRRRGCAGARALVALAQWASAPRRCRRGAPEEEGRNGLQRQWRPTGAKRSSCTGGPSGEGGGSSSGTPSMTRVTVPLLTGRNSGCRAGSSA